MHENSLAQKAGLKPEDLILEMGQYSFYRNNQPIIEFIEAAQTMPINSPVPFLVKRSGQNFAVQINFEEMAQGDMIRVKREMANGYSGEADKLINRQDYPGAVSYLKKAIANYMLGYAYWKQQKFDDAIVPFRDAAGQLPQEKKVLKN